MTESVLSARKVRKRFRLREGEVLALKGLDLDVRENEFICIVGPSGCGKSTFLRMAAGLEPVSEGEILYRGQPVKTPRREVGMVFQEYSLLPWRTVEDNVALGLEFAGKGREERRKVAREYLELVDLAAFSRAMPHELSGGMRQRVATRRSCRSISATRRKRSGCSAVSNTSPTSTKRGMTGPPGRSPGCRKRTIWLQLSR